mmetsp:Transcript_50329/g.109355  ORF Transcript_50329/g.109355 Transcript_50329/m.109355 type:complete len:214 (-) Transcript_50329:376-1017(-)
MSSIIFSTLSKLTFLPLRAREMRSRRVSWCLEAERARRAIFFTCWDVTLVWSREAEGSVFLKTSRASSSLRILIVSERATSSSPRVVFTTAYSSSLVLQSDARFARNFWSSMRDASVSVRSSFMCTISTLSSPERAVFFSMDWPRELISLDLAAESSSKSFTASASSCWTCARLLSKLSFMSLRMPMISPPFGTYPSSTTASAPRKDMTIWRS